MWPMLLFLKFPIMHCIISDRPHCALQNFGSNTCLPPTILPPTFANRHFPLAFGYFFFFFCGFINKKSTESIQICFISIPTELIHEKSFWKKKYFILFLKICEKYVKKAYFGSIFLQKKKTSKKVTRWFFYVFWPLTLPEH